MHRNKREQVRSLVAEGKTYREVAREVGLKSISTVRYYMLGADQDALVITAVATILRQSLDAGMTKSILVAQNIVKLVQVDFSRRVSEKLDRLDKRIL